MIRPKMANGPQRTLLASAVTLALMSGAAQARVIPDHFNAISNSANTNTVTLQTDEKVTVNFNLDTTLQFTGVFDQPGESCNEFWDNGVNKIQVVAQVANANCVGAGCKLLLVTNMGVVKGQVPDSSGGYSYTIPNGYQCLF